MVVTVVIQCAANIFANIEFYLYFQVIHCCLICNICPILTHLLEDMKQNESLHYTNTSLKSTKPINV